MVDYLHPLPTVSQEDVGEGASAALAIPSTIPEAPSTLSPREREVWGHVTLALLEYNLVHLTDGLLLAVVCRTFCRWVDAEEQLSDYAAVHDGSYIVATPNGYEQPHQLFYVARTLKKELLQWLPEAALTIPSFAKMVGERAAPQQGALFEDPVEAHRRRKGIIGMREV